MNRPLILSDFVRVALTVQASVMPGLSAQIDTVAQQAAESHRFLRYQWYAAALSVYGGAAPRTIVVSQEGAPMAALPLVRVGPGRARLAKVPGCYWPFRSFPVAEHAGAAVYERMLAALAREVNVLRIGPVYDDDAAVAPLLQTAREKGWAVMDRLVAESFLLDIAALRAEGEWPRNSTLRKNRFHEKHLASHGALDWQFVSGPGWTQDMFDALATVEQASWIEAETDGRDAKFTTSGHGAFWRAAATDPAIAGMMWAALLTVDGKPMAFSFDINAGSLKYAIANSYDPAVGKHSPGKLLYYRNLVRGLAEGITRVDWGAGDKGYKRVIGAGEGPAIRDWLLVRPGLPATIARLFGGLWRMSGQAGSPNAR